MNVFTIIRFPITVRQVPRGRLELGDAGRRPQRGAGRASAPRARRRDDLGSTAADGPSSSATVCTKGKRTRRA